MKNSNEQNLESQKKVKIWCDKIAGMEGADNKPK